MLHAYKVNSFSVNVKRHCVCELSIVLFHKSNYQYRTSSSHRPKPGPESKTFTVLLYNLSRL